MVYGSEGAFTYEDVETMPLYELYWLYNKLAETRKAEAEKLKNP